MFNYPLVFQTNIDEERRPIKVLDADKQMILYRAEVNDDIVEGKKPCWIFTNNSREIKVAQILAQSEGEKRSFILKTNAENLLGRVVQVTPKCWHLINPQGKKIGQISARNLWRGGCLGGLLELIEFLEAVLFVIFPVTFRVDYENQKVLVLKETEIVLDKAFKLKKVGDYNGIDELFLVCSLFTLFWS